MGDIYDSKGKLVKGSSSLKPKKVPKKKFNWTPHYKKYTKATGKRVEIGIAGNNEKVARDWLRAEEKKRKAAKPKSGEIAKIAGKAKRSK